MMARTIGRKRAQDRPGLRASYSRDRRLPASCNGVAWATGGSAQTRRCRETCYSAGCNRVSRAPSPREPLPRERALMVMGIQRDSLRMASTHQAVSALCVTLAFATGCAERATREMVTEPGARQTERPVSERAMVMFRMAMDLDGEVVDTPFSAFRSTPLMTNVAAAGV